MPLKRIGRASKEEREKLSKMAFGFSVRNWTPQSPTSQDEKTGDAGTESDSRPDQKD